MLVRIHPQPLAFILQVDQLRIAFGTNEIIRDLSFKVARGSALVVIGPNGAGKTVLFRALIGALPYSGSIHWAPGTILGYVPQKLDIERALPVTGMDLLRAKAAVAKASRQALATAVKRVGLEDEALKAPIGALSGGQFQQVLLAMALIGDPHVLLLDEPAAGFDSPSRERVYRLLHTLRTEAGMTVILISHDLSVVPSFATNVLCLNRIASRFGSPQAILEPDVLQRIYGVPVGVPSHVTAQPPE